MNKTVYVLGAGFSNPGGAPSQEKILTEILNLDENFVKGLRDNKLIENWNKFNESRTDLFDFLQWQFHCSRDEAIKIELEDVFTLFDKAIARHHHINKFSDEVITNLRKQLNFCLVYTFAAKLYRPSTDFYENLCHNIITTRTKPDNVDDDNFSFINLNWDLLFDGALNRQAETWNENHRNEHKVSIDYCFYTDSFKKEKNPNTPHITLKAKGIKNIKVLKPHGSFNWLVCMNCGKVFIKFGFDPKIAIFEYIGEEECDKCGSQALKAVIKTPTIVKDFDNVHLSDILHNIEIELLEAKKVVFIGYSLPLADIELRYMFKRCIRPCPNVHVEVILLQSGARYDEILNRYKIFFGNQLQHTSYEGIGTVRYFEEKSEFYKV